MGYYASGDGYIAFDRALKEEELEAVSELLLKEFEDVDLNSGADSISFWASEKYHDDAVADILKEIATQYPVKEGCVQYTGEDGCHWRFRYDPTYLETEEACPWLEEDGAVVFEGDRETVLILEHRWDTEANEGSRIRVYAPGRIEAARADMREMVDKVRQEWKRLCGEEPWEQDYTWTNGDEIHLGFETRGPIPRVNTYSWEIYPEEVIR